MPKGIRYGGKPLGWRKPEGVRAQRQLRAYDDEWALIQRFARLVKYADKSACSRILDDAEIQYPVKQRRNSKSTS